MKNLFKRLKTMIVLCLCFSICLNSVPVYAEEVIVPDNIEQEVILDTSLEESNETVIVDDEPAITSDDEISTSVDKESIEETKITTEDLIEDSILENEEATSKEANSEITEEALDIDENNGVSKAVNDEEEVLVYEDGDTIPKGTSDAIDKFIEAVSKFTSDTSTLSSLSTVLTYAGGVSSAAGGAIAILQMTGVIQDPAMGELSKIQATLGDMKQEIHSMELKLDQVSQQLIDMSAEQKYIDRQTTARDLLGNWNKFNTDYVEPLNTYRDEYNRMIDVQMQSWWNSSHTGVAVCYYKAEGKEVQGYVRKTGVIEKASDMPKKADNNETVLRNSSFYVPVDCIPDTSTVPYDVNSYKEKFSELAITSLIDGFNTKKIIANDTFYWKWNILSSSEKKIVAKEYANAVTNAIVYQNACIAVTNAGDNWSVKVRNAFLNYCDNIEKKNSGVDALVNVYYLTNGFEGDVKADIEKQFDALIVSAGELGIFAADVVCQDEMTKAVDREKVSTAWTDVIEYISAKKTSSFTNNNNYCYVVGAPVEFAQYTVSTLMEVWYYKGAFSGKEENNCLKDGAWSVTNDKGISVEHPNKAFSQVLNQGMDEVQLKVLMRIFEKNNQNNLSFAQYLNNNSTGVKQDYSGKILTTFKNSQNFSPRDRLYMNTKKKMYGKYNLSNVVNDGKYAENQYFSQCDKLLYDSYNFATNEYKQDEILAAKAAYFEGHGYWSQDECTFFYICDSTEEYSGKMIGESRWYKGLSGFKNVPMLKIVSKSSDSSIKGDAGNDIEECSPLLAFGSCYILDREDINNEPIVYSGVDWSKYDPAIIDTCMNSTDEEYLNEIIDELISEGIINAKEKGINVSLGNDDGKLLRDEVRRTYIQAYDRLNTSKSLLDCVKVLNGDKIDSETKKLVLSILPNSYFDEAGECLLPWNAMCIVEQCAPTVKVEFVSGNGKMIPKVFVSYYGDPKLHVWNSQLKEYLIYEIPDTNTEGIEYKRTVRLPVASDITASFINVKIERTKNGSDYVKTYSLPVIRTSKGNYVEMSVTGIGYYSIEYNADDEKKSVSKIDIIKQLSMLNANDKKEKDSKKDNEEEAAPVAKVSNPTVAPLVYKYSNDINVSVARAQQGALCKLAFAIGRPTGYAEAFSVNLLTKGQTSYSGKTGQLVLYIPLEYRKVGRKFALVGVDNLGTPKTLYDVDNSDSTITVNLDTNAYAFDLIYSDGTNQIPVENTVVSKQ